MLIFFLLLTPVVVGLICFRLSDDVVRRRLLVLTAGIHLALTGTCWFIQPDPVLGGWLAVDPLGLLFLTIVSTLFFATSFYAVGFLRVERDRPKIDYKEGLRYSNEQESNFIGVLLLFLASMTLVTLSQHFGLIWVSIEATTLASTPLIYFHRHHRSLEATWKYLLLCSVGIALALLGNFLLAVATTSGEHAPTGLLLTDLLSASSHLSIHSDWIEAAFLFFLVGYGTKMGLAPMHSWLPDAYSESPSMVAALLSGALSNCAFLGLLRSHQVCVAAGVAVFSQELLVVFGLISIAVAALFIIGQTNFKRMLAYSSIEHMGVMALGVGLGGVGPYGTAMHTLSNAFIKAAMFLLAGNILGAFGTKLTKDVEGVSRVIPKTGVLWAMGFLAMTGSPPFGLFLSEFTILKAALDRGSITVAVLYLFFLAVVFISMGTIVLRMIQGPPPSSLTETRRKEMIWQYAPPAALLALALILGVYLPPRLSGVLENVAVSLGGIR